MISGLLMTIFLLNMRNKVRFLLYVLYEMERNRNFIRLIIKIYLYSPLLRGNGGNTHRLLMNRSDKVLLRKEGQGIVVQIYSPCLCGE